MRQQRRAAGNCQHVVGAACGKRAWPIPQNGPAPGQQRLPGARRGRRDRPSGLDPRSRLAGAAAAAVAGGNGTLMGGLLGGVGGCHDRRHHQPDARRRPRRRRDRPGGRRHCRHHRQRQLRLQRGHGGRGIEVTVQRDDGQKVTVAQRDDGDIQLGDRVQIVQNRQGVAQVVRDNYARPGFDPRPFDLAHPDCDPVRRGTRDVRQMVARLSVAAGLGGRSWRLQRTAATRFSRASSTRRLPSGYRGETGRVVSIREVPVRRRNSRASATAPWSAAASVRRAVRRSARRPATRSAARWWAACSAPSAAPSPVPPIDQQLDPARHRGDGAEGRRPAGHHRPARRRRRPDGRPGGRSSTTATAWPRSSAIPAAAAIY